MRFQLIIEKAAKATLGEGPVWDYRESLLYFVDIEGKSIRAYDPASERELVWPAPQKVGAVGLCKDCRLLAALEDGIYLFDGQKFISAHQKQEIEGYRFNDGKVGPDGRFYVGTMSKNGRGAFYRLDHNGSLTKLFGKVYISNGLDWSADALTLYYNDTIYKKTFAFDFDQESGQLDNRRTVFDYGDQSPDGMCIDENGNLHTALWGSGKVITIDPKKGAVVDEVAVPASQTTCITFGGEDLKTQFITTACIDQLADPAEILAGLLYSKQASVRGVRANLFG